MTMGWKSIILLFLSMLLTGCMIQGTVTHQGNPLAGVNVALSKDDGSLVKKYVTNEGGQYNFNTYGYSPGSYTVTPTMPGYSFEPVTIYIPSSQTPNDMHIINFKAIQITGDSDRDGMPDDWEETYGLNPNDSTGENGASGDKDSDGISNYFEYRLNKKPNDSSDFPALKVYYKYDSRGQLLSLIDLSIENTPYIIDYEYNDNGSRKKKEVYRE